MSMPSTCPHTFLVESADPPFVALVLFFGGREVSLASRFRLLSLFAHPCVPSDLTVVYSFPWRFACKRTLSICHINNVRPMILIESSSGR